MPRNDVGGSEGGGRGKISSETIDDGSERVNAKRRTVKGMRKLQEDRTKKSERWNGKDKVDKSKEGKRKKKKKSKDKE